MNAVVANDAVDAVPVRLAVIVPALKLPDPSLETMVFGLLSVALLVTVNVALLELLKEAEPLIPVPALQDLEFYQN